MTAPTRRNPTRNYTDHRTTLTMNGQVAVTENFTLEEPCEAMGLSFDLTGDIDTATVTCDLFPVAGSGDLDTPIATGVISVSANLGGRLILEVATGGSPLPLPRGDYTLRVDSDNVSSAGSMAIIVTAIH